MFDLEQAIADWRQQMLTAGIKTPVPLEELEIHLREEIRQQMKSEMDEPLAFEIAAQQIGPPGIVQNEFTNARATLKTKGISRRFAFGMFVILGTAAFALMLLLFVEPPTPGATILVSLFPSGKTSVLDLYAAFGGGVWQRACFDVARECLLLSLVLTALFALLNFRLPKQSGDRCDS